MDQFAKAKEVKRRAHEQILQLVLNQLKLYTTICRLRASHGSPARQKGLELRARHRLGRAVVLVGRLDLTPEQNKSFQRAFRDLANCLPIHPPATIISIDSLEGSNAIANIS